ncbi:MAG: Na+/H+ antiporter [Blastocatellia bacterium]
MHDTHFAISIFIVLLLIASGVAMAAKWVRVPYTLLLVIVGLLISPMHFLPPVHISPDLILLIFLPALLFEAAWNLRLDHLRENLIPILMLAVPGVCVSVSILGLILHWGIGLSWGVALLFGSMISATDPVSVLALFRKLSLPTRLTTIVEGESLFNDGSAVVIFRIILSLVMSATASTPGGLVASTLREFTLVVVGGLAVGIAIGFAASTLTSYFDDHLLEITLTTIAAYGSFLLAEALHVSPVIAVLLTGLIIGNYGRRVGMSSSTQMAVNSFWEYAAFVVNSLVFLLIGLEVQLAMLAENLRAVAWAVAAMLASRAVAIYGLMPLINRLSKRVPFRWQHVLFWGGLRGSLSLALVLSLPTVLPDRSRLVVMIFGAVIFSLLAQGLTVSPLLKWLKFTKAEPQSKEYDLLQGQLLIETAAKAELDHLQARGVITERTYDGLARNLSQTHEALRRRLSEYGDINEAMIEEHTRRIERHLIGIKKARLNELLQEGVILEETYRQLIEDLNERLARLDKQP